MQEKPNIILCFQHISIIALAVSIPAKKVKSGPKLRNHTHQLIQGLCLPIHPLTQQNYKRNSTEHGDWVLVKDMIDFLSLLKSINQTPNNNSSH